MVKSKTAPLPPLVRRFSSLPANPTLAGITFNKLNAAEAAIAVPGEIYSAGIRNFVETGDGAIPADATLGKALKIAEGSDSVMEHLAKGGVVGMVIIGLGVICLLLAASRSSKSPAFKTPGPKDVQTIIGKIESGDMKKPSQPLPVSVVRG